MVQCGHISDVTLVEYLEMDESLSWPHQVFHYILKVMSVLDAPVYILAIIMYTISQNKMYMCNVRLYTQFFQALAFVNLEPIKQVQNSCCKLHNAHT